MKKELYESVREKALEYYDKAKIVLTQRERESVEIADFGLDDIEQVGLILVTYLNTTRCCAKEMVLFPGMTCPEHTHTPIPEKGYPGICGLEKSIFTGLKSIRQPGKRNPHWFKKA